MMVGDRIVKRIALLLPALFIASCSPSGTTATKGQLPEDEKYNQALEYYTLTQGADPNCPADSREAAMQRARRIQELKAALRTWQQETTDKRVAAKDREEVRRILEDLFRDPVARQSMTIKTRDLDQCEQVTIQFYNRNRAVVSVMFYNRGPTAQAGLDLYLFKHEGQWRIVHRVDWIA
jgi:hypothetical protein